MSMIPAGYMAKKVIAVPDGLQVGAAKDLYSVSECIAGSFCNWIVHWRHNGYWFFNSVVAVREIAAGEGIDLADFMTFYYRVFDRQWDVDLGAWVPFSPDPAFVTAVAEPEQRRIEGFDVVSYSAQAAAECSPLSCNGCAGTLPVNVHCLFDSFDRARAAVEVGGFQHSEPGPYRIVEVSSLPDLDQE
jgi:hypothetical protein